MKALSQYELMRVTGGLGELTPQPWFLSRRISSWPRPLPRIFLPEPIPSPEYI